MKPLILIADADANSVQWLKACLGDWYEVITVRRGAVALRLLAGRRIHVMIVGEALDDVRGVQLIAEIHHRDQQAGAEPRPVILISDDPQPQGGELAYYVLNHSLKPQDVAAIIASAASRRAAAAPAPTVGSPQSPADARRVQRVLEMSRKLALQTDLKGATSIIVSATVELTKCDRAYCLFHDADSGALWSESASGEEDERVAATGVAGFVARTGAAIALDRASDDPRYDPRIDDPRGKGDERMAVQPIVGTDGQVHAVIIAARAGGKPVFSAENLTSLASLAAQAGPLLQQLSLQIEAEAVIEEALDDDGLFRREAVEAHVQRGQRGDVIRVSPAWVGWSYWVMLIALIAACVYLVVGRVDQYSSGHAVIRMTGRTDVPARGAGTIKAIYVRSEDRVTAGQPLVRLDDTDQRHELERVEREFATQLRNRMLDPSDGAADANVRQLRVQRETARAALDDRTVVATRDGVVADIRARIGQPVAPGDTVLAIVDDRTDMYVIALLPGGDRPQLAPGMRLRLEIVGYRYAYQDLVIDDVANDVIGPAEARRYLGAQVADTLQLQGSLVVVRARLPSRNFVADGEAYDYHDGMLATAEVRTRSEPILFTLMPSLKKL